MEIMLELNKKIKLKSIKSFGIEVECGIYESALYDIENDYYGDYNFEHGEDGSVSVEDPRYEDDCWISNCELRYWSENVDDVIEFIKVCWEKGIKQNYTCGNHVHFRPRDEWWPVYLSPLFPRFFVFQYLKKYNQKKKYMNRLFSRYSRYTIFSLKRMLDIFVLREDFDRYKFINYVSFFEDQWTIEIRIMPYCSSVKEHLEQLMFIIKTIKMFEKLVEKKSRNVFVKSFDIKTEKLENELEMKIYETGG